MEKEPDPVDATDPSTPRGRRACGAVHGDTFGHLMTGLRFQAASVALPTWHFTREPLGSHRGTPAGHDPFGLAWDVPNIFDVVVSVVPSDHLRWRFRLRVSRRCCRLSHKRCGFGKKGGETELNPTGRVRARPEIFARTPSMAMDTACGRKSRWRYAARVAGQPGAMKGPGEDGSGGVAFRPGWWAKLRSLLKP